MWNKSRTLLSLILTVLLLQACGFTIQRQSMLAPPLHTLALTFPKQYSPLTNTLVNHFKSIGVHLVAPGKALYQLDILSENTEQIVDKISANTQVRYFNLITRVKLQLKKHNGNIILAPTTIQAQTHYVLDTQQILGLNSLLAQAQSNLAQDIAKQILFRLSATDVTTQLTMQQSS